MLLTGCGDRWHKENIAETYQDYWNYSPGNYEVHHEVCSDNGAGSGGLTANKWYECTFNDVNSFPRQITVTNIYLEDFNDKILHAAASFLEKDVVDLFQHQIRQEVEGVKAEYAWFRCSMKSVDDNIDLYNSSNGLRFNELSLNTLSENNISIELYTHIFLDKGIDDYPDSKQKLLSDVNFIFENYEYSNIKFCFHVSPSDNYYGIEYYLDFDGYQYNWKINYLQPQ